MTEAMANRSPIRVAIVSTPRSGNTWFRKLLMGAYAIPEGASHELRSEDWAKLPAETVHQIHWRRTPEFRSLLREHGFQVVTLARHPLDVLISILHFSWYDPDTSRWLLGSGGDESGLRGAMPRSRVFLDYATSPRAAELLSVSTDWWDQDDTISVRYEDLVRDPAPALRRLADRLGPARCSSIEDVIAANTLVALRKTSVNNHYWKGQPGLWRSLITAAEAEELGEALRPTLDRLGYACDPVPSLTAMEADQNWVDLVGPELTVLSRQTSEAMSSLWSWTDKNTRFLNAELEVIRADRDEAALERDRLREERNAAQRQAHHLATALAHQEHRAFMINAAHEELQKSHKDTSFRLDEAHRELAPFRRLGRFSIRTAEMIQAARDRFPGLDRAGKFLLHRR